MDWLPGVAVLAATEDGGAQVTSYPPRLVLHTTEGGGTVADLAAFYRTSTYWPHFTADPVGRVLAQHLPFSRAGRALSHTEATETNRANCIQVEIIGRAALGFTHDQTVWVGQALLPVIDMLAIHHTGPKFVAGGAGLTAPQRMTNATWATFNGVCGHEHVPQNDHYDPGLFDLTTFFSEDPVTDADIAKLVAALDPVIHNYADRVVNAIRAYEDAVVTRIVTALKP